MAQKIVIADDEAPIRRLLQQSMEDLEDEGVLLYVAHDGAAALDLIRAERPDVVLLDVMMPGRNGFEICEIVKGDPDLADVYIILLTAKGQEVDRQQGDAAGADVYMTKPFDPDRLLAMVSEVLGR